MRNDKRKDGVVKVYGSNGVVGTHVRANTKGACLVIGRKGSFGKINYSKEAVFAIDTTFYVDQRCTRARLRWLYYLLIWARLDGVSRDSAVPGLDREEAYKQILLCCPIEDQIQIAKFLDNQISLIHSLIRAKLRLIERLNEQKQAIIHHAVTRGLDPNVRLKPSGIDWLGDVPEHWEVVPLRRSLAIRAGESIPSEQLVTERSEQKCYPVIGGNGLMAYADKYNTQEWTIVVGRVGALCGNIHLVMEPAWITDNALRVKNIKGFDLKYLALQLQAMNLNRLANANAQPLITGGIIKSQRVAKPPSEEQYGIADYIQTALSIFDTAIKCVRRQIDLIREYRTRLIADVVTGKLDVRGVNLDEAIDETDLLEDLEEKEAEIDSDKEIDSMEGLDE